MKKIEFDDISEDAGSYFVAVIIAILFIFAAYLEFSEGQWVLGSLTLITLVVVPLGIYVFGLMLETGFRNRFPFDFVMHLGYEDNFLREKGFDQIGYIAPGSDNPGIEYVFAHDDLIYNAQVILNAPLNGEYKTSVLLSDKDGNEIGKVEYPAGCNQENIDEQLNRLMKHIKSTKL